jgi:hypothetical protein
VEKEMKTKIFGLLILSILLVGLIGSIVPAKAYSSEVTGLSTNGFDTNQQNFINVGTHNIYIFDNKLIDYDNNGALQGSLTYPAFSNDSNTGYNDAYGYSGRGIAYNSTHIIIVHAITRIDETGGVSSGRMSMTYEAGFVNLNTYAYTLIGCNNYGGAISGGSTETQSWSLSISNVLIIKNVNSTGTFYYFWVSEYMTGYYLGYQYYYSDALIYLGKDIGNSWVAGFSQKYFSKGSTQEGNILKSSSIVVDSAISPTNTVFFLCSNGNSVGNRANIFMIDFANFAVNYIGVTNFDYSYTGDTVQPIGGTGFVYVIGMGAYGGLINIQLVFASITLHNIAFETILFNTTYVHATGINMGIDSQAGYVRPFVGTYPNGQRAGNVSGGYACGFFAPIFSGQTGTYTGGYSLCGYSGTLTGLENNNPQWETNQFGYLWTSQQPQINPYDTQQIGGFQPIGIALGAFVDLQNGKAKANPMFTWTSVYQYNGELTGDIYLNTVISQRPTQVPLKMATSYTYKGNIFINYVKGGNGSFSALSTALSSYVTTYNVPSYVNKIDGSISDGVFTFQIAPVTATQVVYQVMKVNYTLSDGATGSFIYNLGYFGAGMSGDDGNGNTSYPYPSDAPNGGNGGSGGSGGGITITGTISPMFWAGLVLLLVFALMFGSIAGKDGLMAGIVLGISLDCIFGLFPIYLIIVAIIIGIIFALSKSGYIGSGSG